MSSHRLPASNPLDLYIDIRYILEVIRTIATRTTRDIYDGVNSQQARKLPLELHNKTQRLLDQINAAPNLEFLKLPPSNRLEKLRGQLSNYWSLRINNQWRIIFKWKENNAFDVEIIDYHR